MRVSGQFSLRARQWVVESVGLVVAIVFVLSVCAKSLAPEAAEQFLRLTFDLDARSALQLVVGVSLVECMIVFALFWPNGQRFGLCLSGVFLVGATLVLSLAIVKGVPGTCGCFGKSVLSSTPRGAIIRNGALLLLIASAFALAPVPSRGSSRAVPGRLGLSLGE